ncbi:ATPase [uncultured Mycolicibacterium sp.]|uniref:ATPase n=1 Tax=uncultured Mycolicibacterium sp. TaxID=2320817 RepID=UPI00262A0503|nr:ATPase [uncultured Mycolicibacterium sp.]
MADRGADRAGTRTGRERIQKLAQAALNADLTVEQLEDILSGMNEALAGIDRTMSGMNGTLAHFEQTLEVFDATLARINELAPRLHAVVERMEGVVTRVERLVGIGETALTPLTATETAVRGVVRALLPRRSQA